MAFKAKRDARAKAFRRARVREAFMHSSKGFKPTWRGGQGYASNLLRRAQHRARHGLGYNTLYDSANNQIAARSRLASMLQKAAREKIWRRKFWEQKKASYSLAGLRKKAAYAKARRWRQGRS